ncbi:MAG: phenylalanine--tRNA ligase subunit alpha, partial [Nitrospinaceae bacterium]|nr:phenylalanine--tRNA ligase subunit alpha [Nitrospinaceae bacterium]
MIEIINKLRQDFDYRIGSVSNSKQLEQIRIEFLGKKGQLQGLMKELRNASPKEKPKLGKDINLLKQHVEQTINEKDVSLGSKSFKKSSENFDTTLPGRKELTGTLHPITQVMEEITSIFFGLGFQVEEGPEIETDYYNFEALNIPKDHPARDMQDTFYIEDETVLRTHTSPVQIH